MIIYDESKKARENETECFTVAVGNLPMPPFIPKKAKRAIEMISQLDGFVGFYPNYPNGTLVLFRSLNQAKIGKNLMESKGIVTGNNICQCFVEKRYIGGE